MNCSEHLIVQSILLKNTCSPIIFQQLRLSPFNFSLLNFIKVPCEREQVLLPLFGKHWEKRCIVSPEMGGGSDL